MKKYCILILFSAVGLSINGQVKENETAKAEHDMIGVKEKNTAGSSHTMHPDAQWYPDAGLGLFIHWGLSSVKDIDASWPMIVGWGLASQKIDSVELQRIIREKDYARINDGRVYLTPNEYWSMAKDFNPSNYDPDKWIKAAKEAGFTYAVLTTKHHEGFALWPSNYGNFSTKNYMGGRDLLKPFVDACRKYGLKAGLYFSPPDWYFEKEYKNFRRPAGNNAFPELDADLNPRTTKPDSIKLKQHKVAYAEMVRGQILELLTNYGKIDLLWFDGKAPVDNAANLVTQEEIRKLQPGIVINPRMHGTGDFKTFERTPPSKDPGDIWAEFCNPWTSSWANSNTIPFRSNAFILGQFVTMRSWSVNYLPSVGPKADGAMPENVYRNLKVIEQWMNQNGIAVKNTAELPRTEWASVPATSKGNKRYLFAIPAFRNNGMYEKDRLPPMDTILILKTTMKPVSVKLLASQKALHFTISGEEISIMLPAIWRTDLVDVVEIELKEN